MSQAQSGRRNLLIRITTAIIAIPILVLVIWAGLPWVTVLAVVAAAVAATEVCVMATKRDQYPLVVVAVLWAMGLVIAGHFVALDAEPYFTILPATLGGFALAFVGAMILRTPHVLRGVTATAIAALYGGGLLLFVPIVREAHNGMEGLYLLFIGVFANDALAYGVGRLIGKHPMAPSISPNKTWQGAVGGVAGTIGAMVAATAVFGLGVAVWEAILLGIVVAVVGQLGDLLQSKLKRLAGVKDSGWLILFNIPVLYLFMVWMAR